MKILGMGVPELIIILVVVLLIFGPKNLPKLGKAIGSGVKNLRAGMKGDDDKAEAAEVEAEVEESAEASDAEDEGPIERPKKKVVKKVKKAEDSEEE